MVRIAYCSLILSLLMSLVGCELFFVTFFPEDMTYYDKALDLKKELSVIPKYYKLSCLGEIGVLRGFYNDFGGPNGRLILFDSSLKILYNRDGNVEPFQMVDANGDCIIGNKNYGEKGESAPVDFSAAAMINLGSSIGFSDGTKNYVLNPGDTYINFDVYDDTWADTGEPFGITFSSTEHRFKSISISEATKKVAIFLSDINSPSLTTVAIANTSVFGTPPIPAIPDGVIPGFTIDNPSEGVYMIYTDKGIIHKDWNGTYKLYSKGNGSLSGTKEMSNTSTETLLDTINDIGDSRFVFNTTSCYLYHSKMWW